jgi:glycosyltransferase involved in cell wall biosynthesis
MSKVLFIASQPFFQWRGSPIRTGFTVRALAELGNEVDLLVLPIGEEKQIPGVRILRVPNLLGSRDIAIGPSLKKAAFDVIIFFHALGLTFKKRYDVIHCVEDTGAIGVVLSELAACKCVFEKHSDPFSYNKGPVRNLIMRVYAAVERFAIRHADASIVTGLGLVEQTRKAGTLRQGSGQGNKPVHHIFDIPSSLVESTPESADKVRRKLKKKDNELLVTFVGSFAVYQGVDLLFKTIPLVVKKHPTARFVIIGGTAGEIAERKEQLAAEGVGSAVEFVGKVAPDELPDYLAASDVLLSPRLAGANTPLKLLDYLKAGRAIAATDSQANRMLLDERMAILTQPEPDAFADGIGKLLDDAALRKILGQSGRKLIDRVYNYREFKQKLKDCYDQVLSQS